jgi:tetratricopeptide (TPR) repeat protein
VVINKNKIVALAQRYTAKGQFEKAIIEYQKLLKVEPTDIRTWLKIGDLYTRGGSRKEATETYLRVAEQYTANGFHLKSVAVYKQVLKLDPTLVEVHQFLAGSYMDLGLTSEALIQLEQLADVYQKTGHADQLHEVLLKMGEIDPANIATRLRIAELLSKEDRGEEATEHFALACNELKSQGRIDDFLKVAERLLYHDPSRVDLAREAASAYIERGQFKHALGKLQTCFVKDPRDLVTLELLADAFKGLSQPEKAISVYNEMALLLREQGNDQKRFEILEAILAIDSTNEGALAGLGRESQAQESVLPVAVEPEGFEDELPSPGAAIQGGMAVPEVVEEVVPVELSEEEIDARTTEILSETEVLLKYGLRERAIDHLQKVFELDLYNIDAREQIKDVYLELGKNDEALFQLFFLAEAFKDSQPEGAVYYLHEVLKIDPSSVRAREMIAVLGGIMPEQLGTGTTETQSQPSSVPVLDDEEDVLVLEDEEFEVEPESVTRPKAVIPSEVSAKTEEVFEPTINDIPYVAPDNALSEDDLLGGDEIPEEMDAEVSIPVIKEPVEKKKALPKPLPRPGLSKSAALPKRSVPLPMPSRPAPPMPGAPKPKDLPPPPPPPSSPADESVSPADIDEEIEEIEFFLEQGLTDEAKGILEELLGSYPDDPRLKKIAAGLGGDVGAEEPVLDKVVKEERISFDADSLADDLNLDEITHDTVVEDLDEVFNQFKVGVKEQISDTDFSTHYDLGLAYKEMGLFDDAIGEFIIASGDVNRIADVQSMIGMCYAGNENFEEAVASFKKGLSVQKLDEQQKCGLLYELGKAYQIMGSRDEALDCFEEISSIDNAFADVPARIGALRGDNASSGRHSVFD